MALNQLYAQRNSTQIFLIYKYIIDRDRQAEVVERTGFRHEGARWYSVSAGEKVLENANLGYLNCIKVYPRKKKKRPRKKHSEFNFTHFEKIVSTLTDLYC